MPLAWPSALIPSSENWRPHGGTRTGGQALDGSEQLVASPSMRWMATLTIPCHTKARILAARRVIAYGRAQTWLVGPWEYSRVPWATDAYGRLITPDLLRRPSLDGTPFADAGATAIADTLVPATVASAAALNATTLTLARTLGTVFRDPDVVSTTLGDLEPGMLFGIAGRLHAIVEVGGATVSFRPWLRAAAPAGTPVDLVSPQCTMRLASDDTGPLELQLSRFGTITLDLIEAS
ncbi:hypothetical protein [Methylobacterium sp. JK268]